MSFREGEFGPTKRITVVFVDEDGTAINISTATTKELRFKKGNDVVVTKTGAWTGSGTDGSVYYDPDSTFFALGTAGDWEVEGHAYSATNDWRTAKGVFSVEAHIPADT
jgi:hypothetical protein